MGDLHSHREVAGLEVNLPALLASKSGYGAFLTEGPIGSDIINWVVLPGAYPKRRKSPYFLSV